MVGECMTVFLSGLATGIIVTLLAVAVWYFTTRYPE